MPYCAGIPLHNYTISAFPILCYQGPIFISILPLQTPGLLRSRAEPVCMAYMPLSYCMSYQVLYFSGDRVAAKICLRPAFSALYWHFFSNPITDMSLTFTVLRSFSGVNHILESIFHLEWSSCYLALFCYLFFVEEFVVATSAAE